jgi:hypothetical protein
MPDGSLSPEVTIAYTLVGSGSIGTPQCAAPSIGFTGTKGRTSGNISSYCATAGSAIFYSKNGAAFVTYTVPFSIACNSVGDTVELYATASGVAPSVHVFFDNTKLGY